MKPDPRFLNRPKHFWANVRSMSERVGYSVRGKAQVRSVTLRDMTSALQKMGLDASHVVTRGGAPKRLGAELLAYFEHRAMVLNRYVAPRLMDVRRARREFERLRRRKPKPNCPLPMVKQKGEMRKPAYLTGIVNMLVEANCGGLPCDYDPQRLTAFTRGGAPLRTLARRIDGAFPSPVDPIAIWEIKEYYFNKTFGSRVADGIYETLMDGMELEELRANTPAQVRHYLMVDARVWWDQGKSYLCRIIDLLHMGYVDEVLFGSEVIERLPAIVREWVRLARAQRKRQV